MNPGETLTTLKNALEVALDRYPVQLAPTPAEVVFTENKARLLRYDGASIGVQGPAHPTPVLLVPSMVNRYTLLDLTEENSMVRRLLKAGYAVYVLDWGAPSREDRLLPAETWMDGLMHRCVRRVLRLSGAGQLTLGGYCMGGTLSLVYAALHPETVRNLLLLATPVDCSHAGKLALWADAKGFDVEAFVDGYGNATPEVLQPAFNLLIPTWRARHWSTFFRFGHLPVFVKNFVAVSRWTQDNVEIPAQVFKLWTRDLFQENRLINGGLRLGGREVALSDVRAAILNVAAEQDHLSPPASAHVLQGRVGSQDVQEVAWACGHLGLTLGPEAATQVWPAIIKWLGSRSN
jgi:polyhydroxyalkanoate synthase